MTDKNRIFFVEDDLPFGNVLKTFLELNDYQVVWFSDGQEAMKTFKSNAFDIAIIDVMLPHVDGFTIANHIRKLDHSLPFVFLTAKSMKEDVLKGYKSGADDYITKPFDTEVLLYKIEAILKRHKPEQAYIQKIYNIGLYRFDAAQRELQIHDHVIRLTPRESELLILLAKSKDELVPRSEVLNRLWGEDDYFNGRSMDVFIAKLRKHLRHDHNLEIKSIPRSGYILVQH